MAQTNLQRREAYYKKIIEEGKKSKHSEYYQNVCKELESLIEFSNKLKNPEHKMSPDEYGMLTERYKNVQDKIKIYLGKEGEFNSYERNRKGIITEILSNITKDIKALNTCNPLKPGTLSEVMSKSRSHTIILNSKDTKTVGASLNSRIPMKKSDGQKGFFTQMKYYNEEEEWAKAIERTISFSNNEIPDVLKKGLEQVKTNGDVRKAVSKSTYSFTLRQFTAEDETSKRERLMNLAQALGAENLNWEKNGPLSDINQKMYDFLYTFMYQTKTVGAHCMVMETAGIDVDSNLTVRNCAMSDMARLLDCSYLLANSVPMKVILDGKEQDGVFMEAAKGCDINRLKPDDLILDAVAASFESPALIRQVADLQVLDFVCGNIDRHPGNMLYQFKKDDRGNIIATGIQGIDNDCAFGVTVIKEGERSLKLVNPENMRFISREMADKLSNITKEMLQIELSGNALSEKEINAAWDRVQKVNEAVMSKKIQVVEKDKWKEQKLKDINHKDNYFYGIKYIQHQCKKQYYKQEVGKGSNRYNQIQYAQDKFSPKDIMAADKTQNAIKKLGERLKDVEATFYNSSEYDLMEKSFKRVAILNNEIKKYKDPAMIPEQEAKVLIEAYKNLAEKTNRYINLKKVVPYQESGKNRLKVAKELLEFSYKILDKMGVEFERENEKNVNKNIGKDMAAKEKVVAENKVKLSDAPVIMGP